MKKQRNIHRSEQDWQAIFDHFNTSGLTQDVFCQQNQLAPSTFSKWKRQLSDAPISASSDFIEVPPAQPAASVEEQHRSRLELTLTLPQRFQLHLKIIRLRKWPPMSADEKCAMAAPQTVACGLMTLSP